MEAMTRRRVSNIDELGVGDHVCWAYDDPDTFVRAVPRYVAAGLARHQRVVCYLSDTMLDAVRTRVVGEVSGASDAIASGALTFSRALDAYIHSRPFEPDERIEGYSQMADEAIADGYSALRILGEATEIVEDPSASDRWPAYELRADLLTWRKPVIGVCAYDTRRCGARSLSMLEAVHGLSLGEFARAPIFHLGGGSEGELTISGEIDVHAADLIESMGSGAAGDVRSGILDVSGLRFIDVAGMRAIATIASSLASEGNVVRMRGARYPFRRMWSLMSLDDRVTAEFETL